ncbi:hypothetical protein ACXET9_12375 [Brachybacterium sp. DNPG3]
MVAYLTAGVRITIDDDTLRETASDPEALGRWCDEHPDDPRAVMHLRILGRLDDAAIAGRASLADPELPALVRAVRRTRYAQVLQWQGAFVAAEEEFDLAAEETGFGDPTSSSSLTVLASVFQHRAKSRLEHSGALTGQGRGDAARTLLERALEDARRAVAIRTHLGADDEEALASAHQTLDRIERAV